MDACGFTLPLIILNLGGEMAYILEQRLHAQNIAEEKASKVLQDVVATMFSEKFIAELFKPQRVYTVTATRQIFDRLAHSSIMRLNQSSMDKLYDLMTMGCKHQFMMASHPSDLLQITLNHLEAIRVMVSASQECLHLVDHATQLVLQTYRSMRYSEFCALRQSLLRFFQDRRVKVSLFLQDGIQSSDGNIVVTWRGPLPRGTCMPGTMTLFDANGKAISAPALSLCNTIGVTATDKPLADITQPNRPCLLGTNMFELRHFHVSHHSLSSGTHKIASARGQAMTFPAAYQLHPVPARSPLQLQFSHQHLRYDIGSTSSDSFCDFSIQTLPSSTSASTSQSSASTAELSLLASLLMPSASTTNEKFSITNLFPDVDESVEAGGADIIIFTTATSKSRTAALLSELSVDDQTDQGGDDLLDLMDQAVNS